MNLDDVMQFLLETSDDANACATRYKNNLGQVVIVAGCPNAAQELSESFDKVISAHEEHDPELLA